MADTRTRNVQNFLRATTGAALLSLSLLALIGFEWIRRADRDLLVREKSELLASTVVTSLNYTLKDGAELDAAFARLLDLPDLLAVCAYNAEGAPLSTKSKITGIENAFVFDPNAAVTPSGATPTTRLRLHAFDRIDPPETLASASPVIERMFVRTGGWLPNDIQYVGILAQLEPAAGASGAWVPCLLILFGAAGAIACIDQRLRRLLVDPLRALGRAIRADEPEANAAIRETLPGPVAQPGAQNTSELSLEELRTISEKLESLERDARRWRQHAQIVERRVDTHVARETTKIVRDMQRIQRESWTDSLTGVRNRKFLEEKFPPVFDAQLSGRRDLSVIMIDLDNFKLLNDTQGHGAGDEVLRFVGELLQQCLRGDDFAIRYGGDEFIAVLPGVSAENAVVMAERLLALFSQRVKTMFKMSQLPTMTAGVASIDRNRVESPAELLACADHALLAAKQAGKRRARLATVRGDHFRTNGKTMRIQLRASTPVPA